MLLPRVREVLLVLLVNLETVEKSAHQARRRQKVPEELEGLLLVPTSTSFLRDFKLSDKVLKACSEH